MATHLMMPYKQEHQEPHHHQSLHQQSTMRRAQWASVGGGGGGGPCWAAARATPTSVNAAAALYDQSNTSGGGTSQLAQGTGSGGSAGDDGSWEVRAFAEDAASCSGQWPPRSYACSFCQREFRTAQALGGHMNVHRRERAQANQMAILRNNAQQVAAATVTASAASPQTQWCSYSPTLVNDAAASAPLPITSESGLGGLFYSNLTPGGVVIAMEGSPAESSQITSRSNHQVVPTPSRYGSRHRAAAEVAKVGNNNNANMFGAPISSSQYPTSSPLSSPISQGSRSSGSSVVTKGSQGGGGGGGDAVYRTASSPMSVSSNSTMQKLQLGAFLPYGQSGGSQFFGKEATIVSQELFRSASQHQHSTLFSKSMIESREDLSLDLELRLGPSMMSTN